MQPRQLPLFPTESAIFNYPFPTTRYQGSKQKLAGWIWANVRDLEFESVLDVFGGTGAVSHKFKAAGKQVIYNDLLAFNHQIGLALIENAEVTLSAADINRILQPQPEITYPNFIQRTFGGIYFTDAENAWLDQVVYNIDHLLEDVYKRALARFALFQACIAKRPYNLFHRANLYMRTANVKRSFGNKRTWDTPFPVHFRKFAAEANHAVFDNGQPNRAMRVEALQTPTTCDLVYLDPPYLNGKGVGVDYRDFYHFLEGLVNYDTWAEHIDYTSKHRRLSRQASVWTDRHTIEAAFEQIIARHCDSAIVISYRDDGIPSKARLLELLRAYKPDVYEAQRPQQYVLSTKKSNELLLIAP